MVTCIKCGTGWTSSGLPLCPVCGTKVDADKKGSAVATVAPEPRAEPAVPSLPLAPVLMLKEKPVDIEPLDPSSATLPGQELKELRVASRPVNGPLILGFLAFVAVGLLPLTLAFESHRVIGILGFTLTGFFAPFAPIAWMAGLTAEKRRREQGIRPEGRVRLGRLLGQWGTLLLVTQTTLALIAIAAMRLSAKFPPSFWRGAV
jgi:hypothetical protein